ncbi:hypothetical protein DFH06DRAFT_1186383 [Mycena polygramma]|nr:hypothetical protein DFH06DRAFT_1186383 [Mycena polygramma]
MTTPIREDDPDPLAQWTLFLRDYAKGIQRPPPPPLVACEENADSSLPAFDIPLYPPGEITRETARTIAEFHARHGFLPPPRADEETIRLQTIQEYNLFREDQAENFHRCSSLVNSFFPFAPVCTISLFHNAVQVVVSKAGDFPVTLGEELVTETSICGHVVLKKNREPTELGETTGDWRFAGNPWCSVETGVKGYVGVPITLEIDPSDSQYSERINVGVIALMSNIPIPKLSDSQRKVLDDLSSMLSGQLRSTWEGWRRGKETRLRNAVSQFLQTALVETSQQAIMDTAVAKAPVQGSKRVAPGACDAMAPTADLFTDAAAQLRELLEADFVVILDLTSFHATNASGSRKRSHSWVDGRGSRKMGRRVLSSSIAPQYCELEGGFETPEAMVAVAKFLDTYFVTGRSAFSGCSVGSSGFEGLLSALSPTSSFPAAQRGTKAAGVSDTVPHIALPFYSANQPNQLIVVASATQFFTFQPADVTFVSNLGVMLIAHLAQRTIVQADAAKTAFVSQISHELRTPLHGLLGQLDLVRDSFESGELSMVPALLDSAEYCGSALRDIVDDVLDFGKMQSLHETSVRSRHVLVDLAQVITENARSCWLRRLRWHTVSAPSSGSRTSQFVQLAVEYEDRSMLKDWWVSLDAPGFIRILNNLVTNSLKYTAEGLITVSLVSGYGEDKEGHATPQIILRVEDTGRGIAPDFMSKLFDPFTQADSFSPGAGLGLHITKSIVDRMSGTISVESRPESGSIFTVVFPVKDIGVAAAGKPRTMRRMFISSEPTTRAQELPLSPSLTDEKEEKRLGYPPNPTTETETRIPPTPSPSPPVASDGTGDSDDPAPATPTMTTSTKHETEVRSPLSPTQDTPAGNPDDEHEPHLTILVVDDNAISRKILVAMLKRLNVTTHQADDGINALEVFREVHPHVVWTDVSMPRMDGVTAAGEMRKIERESGWKASHIVAITGLGLTDEHIRREALLGPAALDGWLIKGQTNLKALKESLAAVRRKRRLEEPWPP